MRRLVTLLFVILVVAASDALADPVDVRASRDAEFGRIVFIWPSPVGHQLLVRDDGVVVRFNRPIEATYERVTGALSRYVHKVTPEPDGRGVYIVLKKRKFDTYSYDSGTSIVVEIADTAESRVEKVRPAPDAIAATQPDPKPAVRTAEVTVTTDENLPPITVRGGAHADYTRIVFDWPTNVPYSFSQEGGVVSIIFERAANLNTARLASSPPRLLGEIVSRARGRETLVLMSVPATSNVRHFLSGSKVVIDIREPTGSPDTGKLPLEVLATLNQEDVPDAEKSKTEKDTPSANNAANTISPETTKPTPEPDPEPTPEPGPETVSKSGGTSSVGPLVLDKGEKARPSSDAAALTTGQGNVSPEETSAVSSTPVVAVAKADVTDLEEAVIKVSENLGDGGGMDLRFDWTEPVGAAVFRRAGKLWIAFDAKRRVDSVQILGRDVIPDNKSGDNDQNVIPDPKEVLINSKMRSLVFGVEQLAATGGTVLRFTTAKDVNPILRRDGFSWIFTFRKQKLEPKTPLEINAQPDSPVGARIFVPTPEPGQPIGVTDPDIGNNLVIVPVIPLSHGLAKGYTYPEVSLPQTGQGILVVANTDNLRVRPLRQGIELTSAIPLSISNVSEEQAAGSKLSAIGPVSRLLDLKQWELKQPTDFRNGKQQLQRELSRAKGVDAEQAARWNLANFYFANAFAAEALGVLRQMVSVVPEFENAAELKLIRGASQYLLGRYADAAEDLADPSLDVADEGAFWRAVVIAKSGQMNAAAHELRRTSSVSQSYPRPLRVPLEILIAEAAVEIGDIESAVKFLDALNSGDPTRREQGWIAFIEGKMAEVSGDEDGAVSKFETAIEADDRAILVKATFARMDLLLRMQQMEPDEAIEILEGLRFLWRGGEFEFNLLRRLGSLYIENNGYRRGLLALRQAATYYRDHEEAAQITQQMSDTFNLLYLDDVADEMAPVKAIALYEEFRELTPAGRSGDEMIRKLADRLVKVDLFDQAAELLDGQVRFRLKGVEKAQVGSNLALVHAIAREHESVLEVLDATNIPGIPNSVATRRLHLRALALIGLNQEEQAVAILKRDKTLDGDLIRAEMYWKLNDWTNASRYLHRVVRAVGARPGREIDSEQAVRILNLAAAYTLSGNERAMAGLRSDYGAAMANSQFNEAFRLIAAPVSLGLIDPVSVLGRVQTVTNFRSFLEKYKKQINESDLSTLTNVGRKMDETNLPLGKG